jgi:2-amino-4-hydroxy-6-hydroxymethyldihydropteridine diphosphokinase
VSDSQQDVQTAYIGLGSNLDDPVAQVQRAFDLLRDLPNTQLTGRSSLYESAPFGPVEQPNFINAVASIATELNPADLLAQLQNIQRNQGRTAGGIRWGPRVLDLDLLLYGDVVIETTDLTVPHAGIAMRNFVLLPLRELSPDLFIPKLGRVSDLKVSESEPKITRI